MTGGGGKCEFSNGIGSFESAVAAIASSLQPLGATGYDVDGYMRGKQYYFGFTSTTAAKDSRCPQGLNGNLPPAEVALKIDRILEDPALATPQAGPFHVLRRPARVGGTCPSNA